MMITPTAMSIKKDFKTGGPVTELNSPYGGQLLGGTMEFQVSNWDVTENPIHEDVSLIIVAYIKQPDGTVYKYTISGLLYGCPWLRPGESYNTLDAHVDVNVLITHPDGTVESNYYDGGDTYFVVDSYGWRLSTRWETDQGVTCSGTNNYLK